MDAKEGVGGGGGKATPKRRRKPSSPRRRPPPRAPPPLPLLLIPAPPTPLSALPHLTVGETSTSGPWAREDARVHYLPFSKRICVCARVSTRAEALRRRPSPRDPRPAAGTVAVGAPRPAGVSNRGLRAPASFPSRVSVTHNEKTRLTLPRPTGSSTVAPAGFRAGDARPRPRRGHGSTPFLLRVEGGVSPTPEAVTRLRPRTPAGTARARCPRAGRRGPRSESPFTSFARDLR